MSIRRGDRADSGRNLDDADRKGYLVAEYILNANKYMMDSRGRLSGSKTGSAPSSAQTYGCATTAIIRPWSCGSPGMNFFNSAVDADPRYVGRRGWDQGDERWQRLLASGKEMFDGLKKLDPTRVYYSHAGAYTGRRLHDELLPGPHPAPGARRVAERLGGKRRDADFHGRVWHPHGLHVPPRTPRV